MAGPCETSDWRASRAGTDRTSDARASLPLATALLLYLACCEVRTTPFGPGIFLRSNEADGESRQAARRGLREVSRSYRGIPCGSPYIEMTCPCLSHPGKGSLQLCSVCT